METDKANIYTIIVTYNGMSWIKACLNSVVKNTHVVVIDNNSSDDTVNFIKAHFPEVILLEQKENLGFGKANNLGIKYALSQDADYFLLLNQDAKMTPNAPEELAAFSKEHPSYGILSPIHCDWSGEFLEASFAKYVAYNNNEDFYTDFVLNKPKKKIYDVPFIAAACWFIPKDAILTVGGFDPIFFHIGEDSNYAQRILFHKYKIGVLPHVSVHHDTKNRTYKKVEKYSDDYFYKTNYNLKLKLANPNKPSIKSKVTYYKRQIQKDMIFALMQLKLNHFHCALKELRMFKSIVADVNKSKAITVKKGTHYL